ncbi:competence protein ComJ [Bradyrhizobium sp. CCBAU 53340]|uniref:competence protein ComJ n=2 Tax=Bradyrhizobium TaxID=374 RepID=UPI001AED2B3D|nr:competence protein ComJ [Bradyrhizobium sp. CCBAU 53340]
MKPVCGAMTQRLLGAARAFASHYQIVVCDDPFTPLVDDENWDAEKTKRGFAGLPAFRMIGTEADLNDHWVELVSSDRPPSSDEWQRITCVHFHSGSGRIHVMSVIDNDPPISADIERGDYAVYAAAQNLGIDQSSLGESGKFSDAEIAERRDIEWYRLFLVPGKPEFEGRVVDR